MANITPTIEEPEEEIDEDLPGEPPAEEEEI